MPISRRTFVETLAVSAAAASILGTQQAAAQPQQANIPDAFASGHQPKMLNFDPAQLDGLSEKLINSHWQNNYGGSVNALNTIKTRLKAALADDELPAYIYNDLKREHLMRTGSVVLHEYYFENIAPPGARSAELDQQLQKAFGSTATWEKEFRRIGSGLGGGSGWTLLAWNTHTGTLENYWMADHMHAPAGAVPIIVMDMYEHSYQMDYGAAAADYIAAFMRNINWQVAAERLNTALEA
ncbi:MAG: Fe-Mn family superoxide dismutase [Pseudomonadota bacterium]